MSYPHYQEEITRLRGRVSAVALRAAGGLVIANGRRLVVIDDGEPDAVIASAPDGLNFNDAKPDASGRIWLGTVADPCGSRGGHLFRVDEHGQVAQVLDGVEMSNGLGWSAANDRFYYVDTPAQRIDVFDFELAIGTISNRRTFATIPASLGLPDGLAVDAEDGVWLAVFRAGKVLRFDTDGRVVEEVRLPVSQVTSCTFGGPGMTTLFVTSAAYGLAPAAAEREPLAGRTFRLDVGVRGLAANPFGM